MSEKRDEKDGVGTPRGGGDSGGPMELDDPGSVEVQADAEADGEGYLDDVITLVDADMTETRYVLRGETKIGGVLYRALNPEGGGDTVYFRYVKGDEHDTYTDLEGEELDKVVSTFETIFAAEDAADERERGLMRGVVEPGEGEAASQG